MRKWEARVRADARVPQANRMPEPILRDHIPGFIDLLADALELATGQGEIDDERFRRVGESGPSHGHALDRYVESYSLESALREWLHFRRVVIECLLEQGAQSRELMPIHAAIDAAVGRVAADMREAYTESRTKAAAEQERNVSMLETLITTLPMGVAFVERDLRYARVNDAFAAINGISVAEVEGRTIADVLPELAPTITALIEDVFATGKAHLNLVLSGPTKATRGNVGHWMNSYYPVRDRNGIIFMVGCVVVDVTERENQANQLRDTVRFRDRFMAILGHDLRSPLTTILMSAAILERSSIDDIVSVARRIDRSGRRMSKMIDDLLDLTRAQMAGGIPIHPRPMALDQMAKQVLDELQTSRPKRLAVLESHGNCRGVWDPDRLAQVVSNLVSNAFDYSPDDSEVRVTVDGDGPRVRLKVANAGAPIPVDLAATLFDPFRRAAAGQNPRGLGLGLFIVKRIVEGHCGSVTVRSDERETCFDVDLPRICEVHEADDDDAPSDPAPAVASQRH